jgi:hypothetical protein
MSGADGGTAEATLVAGVFGDHSAAAPAIEKLKGMGAQFAQAGVSGSSWWGSGKTTRSTRRPSTSPASTPRQTPW